jgi:hypothetical protein
MKIKIKESKQKKLKESIVLDNVPNSLASGFIKTSFFN